MKSNLRRVILFAFLLILTRACPGQEQSSAGPKGEEGLQQQADYAPYPPPDHGYVTDLGDLLNLDEEEEIERWLWQTESRTGVEIAVVTIRSMEDYPNSANDLIESFARGLFDRYRIGNLPKNNGVLLLVSREDRKARIELGKGYGRVRDADASRIMERSIVPKFKAGEYSDGIRNGVSAIMLEFAGIRIGFNWPLVILIVAFVVLLLITISLFRSGKRGWGWIGVGLLIVIALFIFRNLFEALRHMPRGSSDSWSSGGYGGGFGGGSSGGGGATGSW